VGEQADNAYPSQHLTFLFLILIFLARGWMMSKSYDCFPAAEKQRRR
jgi:hypothetical protein